MAEMTVGQYCRVITGADDAPVQRWTETPFTKSARDALPLLLEARDRLANPAAPQASRLAERISHVLADIIIVSGDAEAYFRKWPDNGLADRLWQATTPYNKE